MHRIFLCKKLNVISPKVAQLENRVLKMFVYLAFLIDL